MPPEHKANLQGELEVLEQMLWELETETERISRQQTPQKPKLQRSMGLQQGEEGFGEEAVQDQGGDEEVEAEEEEGGASAEERLGDVCYKSLEVGLELARKVDTVRRGCAG
ncbi:unnamed protein product [Phytophthora fragariaefolia]|uniref:Unnamed protein product n=1 Tax=Phytophthora fragariaefolia TaxID=1490495 RepID=A0A9W6XPS8_9STRA|nr:unnamed protein product [Phytophthora fragariaefolia]